MRQAEKMITQMISDDLCSCTLDQVHLTYRGTDWDKSA